MKSKDPESLVCSESRTINKDNFEEIKDAELTETYDDVYAYSCSFVDKQEATSDDPLMQCSIDFRTLKKFNERMSKIAAESGDAEN